MSFISADINTEKTFRSYFSSLSNREVYINLNGEMTPVRDVDFIWDGQEYYIIFREKTSQDEKLENPSENNDNVTEEEVTENNETTEPVEEETESGETTEPVEEETESGETTEPVEEETFTPQEFYIQKLSMVLPLKLLELESVETPDQIPEDGNNPEDGDTVGPEDEFDSNVNGPQESQSEL